MAQPQEFRERTEELERASLSSWATLALETKGRDRFEAEDPLRTVFQSDRDRVLGCDAWRALAGKSAVLPARAGRSRLDEALDVVRVARTLARALRLNEDLTEAIALGQGLGAPPYAGAGAEALEVATGAVFRPEEQALRVVERLGGDGAGLNLAWETRDGILHQDWEGPAAATLEGEAARYARRIVEVSNAVADAEELEVGAGVPDVLGGGHAVRLQRMSVDVARSSVEQPELSMSRGMDAAQRIVAERFPPRVRASVAATTAHARAVHCVASVAVFLLEGGVAADGAVGEGAPAAVVDDIAARTDAELLRRYRASFEPPVG